MNFKFRSLCYLGFCNSPERPLQPILALLDQTSPKHYKDCLMHILSKLIPYIYTFTHNKPFVKVRRWQRRRQQWRRRALLRTFIKWRYNFSVSCPCLYLVIANVTFSIHFGVTEPIFHGLWNRLVEAGFEPTTFLSSADHHDPITIFTSNFFFLLKL